MKFFGKLFKKSRPSSKFGSNEKISDLRCTCLFVHCECGINIDEAGDKIKASGIEIDPEIYKIYSKEMIAENLELIQAVAALKYAFQSNNDEK